MSMNNVMRHLLQALWPRLFARKESEAHAPIVTRKYVRERAQRDFEQGADECPFHPFSEAAQDWEAETARLREGTAAKVRAVVENKVAQ